MSLKPAYRCWAEVDLLALRENLAWIRHRLGEGVKLMTVVKADAYGHGLKQIAALMMQSGTDLFGVATLAEARSIHAVGRGWPVLMLGACLPEEIPIAVRDGVMPTISTLAEARLVSRAALRLRRIAPVHVKVDTGMGRLGVALEDAEALVLAIRRMPGVRLAGLYTHYASAEDDAAFTARQRRRFEGLLASLAKQGVQISQVHAGNSAALLHEPDGPFNLIRPGLLVYGIVPGGRRRASSSFQRHLRPALAFKCRVSLVKTVPRGASLSYGRTYVARRPRRIATVTAGYGDGYLRAGGNRAFVLIRGRRCPVVGRITMDQTLVDVSAVPGVRVGDEVVLIGRQGKECITAGELAGWTGTIPWETLTAISYRVPRVYLGGQAA